MIVSSNQRVSPLQSEILVKRGPKRFIIVLIFQGKIMYFTPRSVEIFDVLHIIWQAHKTKLAEV